ncbi:SDR family NAD(P)-dependent oxidoreductase [Geodermatophilus sabuli]|uniref:NAD(P)-dependent dehydrogenase, short-chain alcohol dehydrogenase family n=1 Tax=Geodermatophilus sabuli TaxID=1564158 RepID=A0A285E834_9ACTN|nr:SDR family NAD(P)-dependent oxidoreductase [Geodermatophilus sabuli]MBB3082018.1 NAD(P)-dependent dehydrogenase (short-subunit alcohol dehydrogenase family) [Geodermatophilus sabuli]SNX95110.1 NAD(P)-dependent dehydrogenase, short-chain alcohol dehydrogenase family [Geodermatophilus sabuli]
MTEFSESLTDPFGDAGELWMTGRTALVTGGGQQSTKEPGVGYAISRVLAAHGARVAVLDRDLAAAQRTVDAIEADGGKAIAVVADLLDDDACKRAVEETVAQFGGFDTLVNNVAVGDRAGIFEVTPERFHQLMDLNLTTAWQMTRHAVEVLPTGSAIVNISSVGVRARGPGMVYNLAKAGLENMTVGAANTLGERGIRVNCVQVGAIWGAFAAANMSPEMRAIRKGWSGLGTEGSPWDIAQAVLFLSSDRARWVSGQILSVDGGPSSPKPPKPAGDAR